MDTNVKVWDLKTKNPIVTLKNHRKKVTALNITPDSRTLMTGDEEGIVQSLQLRMQRIIYQYQINSAILSIDSMNNPLNMLSIGSMDRLARLYMLNAPFSFIGQTKNQTMPISNCLFYEQNILFTAGTDNLKVWKILPSQSQQNIYGHESDNYTIFMIDNIQTSSKNILHMAIDDKVQQISYSGGSLSYHECLLSEINFEGTQMAQYKHQSTSLKDIEELTSPLINPNKNLSTIKRGQSYNKSIQKFISSQKAKDLFSKRNQSIKNTMAKQIVNINQEISDVLSNINKVSTDFHAKKKQTQQIQELMGLMGDEHSKFLKIISSRAKSIQTLLDAWQKQNFKLLIQQLKSADIYVVSDVLNQILSSSQKYMRISLQFGVTIAQRSKQMILSKHMTLVKSGIIFLLKIISLFKQQMIKLKLFGIDKGVDLARQQRLRRFDQLIQEYIEVFQSHRIKKLIQKSDKGDSSQSCGKLTEQLQNQLKQILNKVYGKGSDNFDPNSNPSLNKDNKDNIK